MMRVAIKHMDNLSEWLFRARRAAGWTQDELAAKSGVSKSYISMLERGGDHPLTGKRTMPSREKLSDLARALRVDVSIPWRLAGYATQSEDELPTEVLDDEMADDPLRVAYDALYGGVPPELRPDLIGVVARYVRDHQRSETTHGKKAEIDDE